MKRLGNLYENTYKMENIISAFNEVCKNTKNKMKVEKYKEYKCIYISRVYNILKNREYKPGPSYEFIIHDPKERRIVSQNLQDKIINHVVTRQILYPAILPCLIDANVASRKGYGTSKGIELKEEFERKCNMKYEKYYVLKCDISKFFMSIDKEILKEKVKRRIKDKKALKIVFDIIDSGKNGLDIGCMTSQALAIFYLNDLDHFIKEKLKIKYYVRYQDDMLLYHESKEYLKYCFEEIKKYLNKEKLILNKKSRIFTSGNNFIFLGRKKNSKYAGYRYIGKRLKNRFYLYEKGRISLNSLVSSIVCYKSLDSVYVKKLQKKTTLNFV